MNPAANPRYDVLRQELRKLKRPFRRWEGLLFRAAPLEYGRVAKLLDGQGSFAHGGRWSAAGTFPATNLACTPEGAVAESSATFSYYNFTPSDVRPRVLVAVRARFSRVLDLMAPRGLRARAWVEIDHLLAEDWHKVNDRGHESQSQALGRAAHDFGAEALLVPSARVAGSANLIYFPRSLVRGSRVEILGEGELKRWMKAR